MYFPRSSRPIPTLYPRLARQRQNLELFLREEHAAFSLLRYEPWVAPDPTPRALRVGRSALIPNTVGLFSTSGPLAPWTRVTPYCGMLMSVELHDAFNFLYHCPTAVRLDVLDYNVDAAMATRMKLDRKEACERDNKTGEERWTVRMVLVGDPCTFGPIVNSPRGVDRRANCKLAACKRDQVSSMLTSSVDGKYLVSPDVLFVHRNSRTMLSGEELLADYDEDDKKGSPRRPDEEAFWARLADTDEYCDVCFCKHHTDASNPLIVCSHNPVDSHMRTCLVGRHRNCFDAPLYRALDWFCPAHSEGKPLPSLLSPDAITASLAATPPPPPSRPSRALCRPVLSRPPFSQRLLRLHSLRLLCPTSLRLLVAD